MGTTSLPDPTVTEVWDGDDMLGSHTDLSGWMRRAIDGCMKPGRCGVE